MDSIELLKTARQMCTGRSCDDCPVGKDLCVTGAVSRRSDEELRLAVERIEEWGETHPLITNAEKFREVFGYNGAVVNDVKPGANMYRSLGSCGYTECTEQCASRCYPRCPMWWNDPYPYKE